jgi:copper chaperone CopZ
MGARDMKQTYQISGMHCRSCVAKITTALEGKAEKVEVTLTPPRAVLDGASIPSTDALNTAVASTGNYTLTLLPDTEPAAAEAQPGWLKTYYPLLLIVGMITLTSLKGGTLHDFMLNFMAGFFLVFGAFKLFDIRGFRDAYATYDLLATRWPNYGLIYPFLELALGFAFLFRFELTATYWASLMLMGFSSLGVINALRKKQKIRCACLGTMLNLPMSTITLVEDLGMVMMAVVMIAAA